MSEKASKNRTFRQLANLKRILGVVLKR